MSSPSSRTRADLHTRTGIDFSQYVDDELVDSITGWSGLLGLVKELGMSIGIGLLVAVGAIVVAVVRESSSDESTGLVIGGIVTGTGVAAFTFALRLRRRIPAEANKVFEVAGAAADRVARDVASGRLTISSGDAARGVTLVAAIPALTRAARRRFPLLGTVAAPMAGAILSRALMRVWPTGHAATPLSGLERPARRLEDTLRTVSQSVLPRVTTAVRWATLPLAAGGLALVVLGAAVVLLSFSLS